MSIMSMFSTKDQQRARAMWRRCLASAFRTALACTIVGCITLYGPASLQNQIAFPAFSYVTVILIVTDATLGDTLHRCWLALYATANSLGPAMFILWLVGPARFTTGTISMAVALAAFVVAFPEGTHLIAKRIALGQIVLVYVIGFINGAHTDPIMHPVHVAASTAVGVLACVLAVLLPYPRLACQEVKQKSKPMAENASERLKLYVKAFCAEDNSVASASVSQAKSLAIAGTKLLQSIKRYQESMESERFPLRLLRRHYVNQGERLQELEIPLRGMEMALISIPSFPVSELNQECQQRLAQLEEHIGQDIKLIKNCSPSDSSSTVREASSENSIDSLQSLQTIPSRDQELPPFFFLFCMKLLHCKSLAKPIAIKQGTDGGPTPSSSEQNSVFKTIWSSLALNTSDKRLVPAVKCSLSLGLAVLFGLIYSKENGYWAGLPVAISLSAAREATFKVANVKAQGTVLGTVYGVLGCFIFEKILPIRFLSLLPWFVVSSFLRRSKIYGQAGGISAAIGAVVILGRKNFGPPSEFAIARITETFIGLSWSIMVELLLQPTRASSIAKVQLSKTFKALHDSIGSVSIVTSRANMVGHQRRLKLEVTELGKYIGEAEVEPNFWFLPFHGACYGKLLGSLSKMVDLLDFSADAVGFLEQESQKFGASWKEIVNKLDGDLQLFKDRVGSIIKCCEDITCLKSLASLDKELESKNISLDIESGKSPSLNFFKACSGDDKSEIDTIMESYLKHCEEVVGRCHAADIGGEKKLMMKNQIVLSLSALGFCISTSMKESREIEKEINELIQWENPSYNINLHEISCKIHAYLRGQLATRRK